MPRKDKGTKRELTKLALRIEKLAEEADEIAAAIRAYDQRDRLKADKQ